MKLNQLVESIQSTHDYFQKSASSAINIHVTYRNWLIGFYLKEYEQNGEDRAKYGEQVLNKIADKFKGNSSLSYRSLRLYRQFYICYPQIWQSVIAKFKSIGESVIGQLEKLEDQESNSPLSLMLSPEKLVQNLSFTHLSTLIGINDPIKRVFYEVEAIKGNWSVRELKRQVSSLYFERSAYSKDKEKLSALVQEMAIQTSPEMVIKDPYVFEFLGLKPQEVMLEKDLEDALLLKLQDFLLELGKGFCFEARQKRIRIGEAYYFIDLVFYHRILKCHILVELKSTAFSHENIGQLNTYVNYFKEHEMAEGDNPPIGILLCTEQDHALVKYALASMKNELFVSKYQLQLPEASDITDFIEKELKTLK